MSKDDIPQTIEDKSFSAIEDEIKDLDSCRRQLESEIWDREGEPHRKVIEAYNLSSDAYSLFKMVEARRSLVRAKTDLRLRERFEKNGEKVTEKKVKKAIKRDDAVKKQEELLIAVERLSRKCEGLVKAAEAIS